MVPERLFQGCMPSTFKQWVKSAGMTPSPCIKFQTLKSVLNIFIVNIVSHKKHLQMEVLVVLKKFVLNHWHILLKPVRFPYIEREEGKLNIHKRVIWYSEKKSTYRTKSSTDYYRSTLSIRIFFFFSISNLKDLLGISIKKEWIVFYLWLDFLKFK